MVKELEKTVPRVVFFDLRYGQEESNQTSKVNRDEAAFITELISTLYRVLETACKDQAGKELRSKVGIITPYKQQMHTLKDGIYPLLRQLKLPLDTVEINTVDAYQGREKDIIIISCVRGSQERTLGFLNDYRRMNVAITRAKSFLWVVGNGHTLRRNDHWDAFVRYASTAPAACLKLQSKEQWSKEGIL